MPGETFKLPHNINAKKGNGVGSPFLLAISGWTKTQLNRFVGFRRLAHGAQDA
jgi:hypothetical protein